MYKLYDYNEAVRYLLSELTTHQGFTEDEFHESHIRKVFQRAIIYITKEALNDRLVLIHLHWDENHNPVIKVAHPSLDRQFD